MSLTAPKLAMLLLLTAASAHAASLELQGRCADQARKVFEEDGWADKPMAIYVNHYDETSKKCFMATQHYQIDGDKIWTIETVFDAFEGTVYGSYLWRDEDNKKYLEVAPKECSVTTLNGHEIQCSSDDEFDQLIHSNFGVTMK